MTPQLPEAPRDARLLHPDGTETPLELAYAGTNEEGCHVWEATAAVAREGDQLQVAMLPARTAIRVQSAPPPCHYASCRSCGYPAGPFASYEEFDDWMKEAGWEVGEELVLCPACLGRT